MRPPQRNLGPGEDWGRWVEEQLQGLQRNSTQSEQGNQRSFANNGAALKQLTNQLNAIPVTMSGNNAQNGGWSTPSGGTFTLANLSFDWPGDSRLCDVVVIFNAKYGINPSIPQAYNPTIQVSINDQTISFFSIYEQMSSYTANGNFSATVTRGEDDSPVTVSSVMVNSSSYNNDMSANTADYAVTSTIVVFHN